MASIPRLIMGTAGHVDHGKTSLVKYLTGVDLDTLPEEKERGLTINLGFTYFDTPSGLRIGVVDVPGHKRFIHTMVSGAQGIDFVLLLVACDDSVMPQTREHLEILRLMGIERGIVVLTKKDLVDDELREMVKDDVKEFLAGSFLGDAPLVSVSSVTGEGMEGLTTAIDKLSQSITPREAKGKFRMFVDRVFTVAGAGKVVTGTVLSGEVREGDELELLGEGVPVKIRQIQVHGQTVKSAQAGQRCALNIKLTGKAEPERGDLIVAAGAVNPTYMIDARLECLPDLKGPLSHWQRVRLYLGTTEAFARLVLLDKEMLPVGDSAYVQFRLEKPIPAVNGDRYIIRDVSGGRTLGGGAVLDAHPAKHKRKRAQMVEDLKTREKGYLGEVIELEAKKAGYCIEARKTSLALGVDEDEFRKAASELSDKGLLTPLGRKPVELYFHASAWTRLREKISSHLEDHHKSLPQLATGISEGELRKRIEKDTGFDFPPDLFSHTMERLAIEGKARKVEATWALASHMAKLSGEDEEKIDSLLSMYVDNPYSPRTTDEAIIESGLPREVARRVLDNLLAEGKLTRISREYIFEAQAVDRARKDLLEFLDKNGGITLSEFRGLIGTSRKYALPLINYFDSIGVTVRDGDIRRLGKRKG